MDLTYDVGGKVRLIPNSVISSGEYEINIHTRNQHGASSKDRLIKKLNLNVYKSIDSSALTPGNNNLKISHKAQKRASKMLNKNQFNY